LYIEKGISEESCLFHDSVLNCSIFRVAICSLKIERATISKAGGLKIFLSYFAGINIPAFHLSKWGETPNLHF
jgi:hypothetical protein